MKNRWQTKVDALIRLAEDQEGKPEGALAREKLVLILQKHPEAVSYQPILDLAWRDLTTRDVVKMKWMGISTAGSWTGANLMAAIDKMLQDYYQRRMIGAAPQLTSEPTEEPP